MKTKILWFVTALLLIVFGCDNNDNINEYTGIVEGIVFGLKKYEKARCKSKNRHKKMPEVGLEPTRGRASGDFESPASTNFTTPACVL